MQITAKVIEDSIGPRGDSPRLTTLQLTYPRFIHSEFMTHRVFSRNAASSRAIPVAKMIEQVRNDPAMPVHWGKNQPGMQAREENDTPVLLDMLIEYDNPSDVPLFTFERGVLSAQDAWKEAAHRAAEVAEAMNAAGYHKQVVNRLLEPFQWMHVIVTATEWANFFELRDHPDAEPNIRVLAHRMLESMATSTPGICEADNRLTCNWHLPYVTDAERVAHPDNPRYLAKLSAARCARVSYLTHDGAVPDPEKDLALYERLVGSRPLHASPVEHQAYPDEWDDDEGWIEFTGHGNFVGWVQYRKLVEIQTAAEELAA